MATDARVSVGIDSALSARALQALFAYAPWARTRKEEDIRRMLAGSLLLVSARRQGNLIGFGRAWGDGIYRAIIDDIVVLPEERKRGIGTALIGCLIRELSHVEEVALSCRSEVAPFYERLGFERYTGLHLKKKVPQVAGPAAEVPSAAARVPR
jgi:GNAT superfamily N-acetyltransferase